MSDPLAYLPMALAGANGKVDGVEVRRLVSAGVALLQRCAPLVRALHRNRSALLLPPSPHMAVALAASDGRGALLLDPNSATSEIARECRQHRVGAVFTTESLAAYLPQEMPRVVLDGAPTHAVWSSVDSARTIDLALHSGLPLEGESDMDGAEEEALLIASNSATDTRTVVAFTHRSVLAFARASARTARLTYRDHTLVLASFLDFPSLVLGFVAPLLAGGSVSTSPLGEAEKTLDRLERTGVSMLVGEPSHFEALLVALLARGRPLDAPVLQRCIATLPCDDALRARWHSASGVLLQRGEATLSENGSPAATSVQSTTTA